MESTHQIKKIYDILNSYKKGVISTEYTTTLILDEIRGMYVNTDALARVILTNLETEEIYGTEITRVLIKKALDENINFTNHDPVRDYMEDIRALILKIQSGAMELKSGRKNIEDHVRTTGLNSVRLILEWLSVNKAIQKERVSVKVSALEQRVGELKKENEGLRERLGASQNHHISVDIGSGPDYGGQITYMNVSGLTASDLALLKNVCDRLIKGGRDE
jgi:hypothetical protein